MIVLIFVFFFYPNPAHEQVLSLRFLSIIVQSAVDDCSDAVALPVACARAGEPSGGTADETVKAGSRPSINVATR